MGRYRTADGEVEAVRWTGPDNTGEVFTFLGLPVADSPQMFCAVHMGGVSFEWGDWIVKDSDGFTFPVKPEHFSEMFEAMD